MPDSIEYPSRFSELNREVVTPYLTNGGADERSKRSLCARVNEAFRDYKRRYGEVDPNEEILSPKLLDKWLGDEKKRLPPEHPTNFAAIIGLAYVLEVNKPTLVALLTHVPTLAAYYDPYDRDAILCGAYERAGTKWGQADARALRDMMEERWGPITDRPLALSEPIRRRTRGTREVVMLILGASALIILTLARGGRVPLPPEFEEDLGKALTQVLLNLDETYLQIERHPGPPIWLNIFSTFPITLFLSHYVVLSDEGPFNYVCAIGMDPEMPLRLPPKESHTMWPSAAQPANAPVRCWSDIAQDPPTGCELILWQQEPGESPKQLIPDPADRICPISN